MDASQDRIRQSAELVRAGALFGVIYWLFESIRDLIVQGNRSIFSVVFLPSFREFWMRFLVVCILILFGVIAQRLCRIYTRQNDKGKGTPGVREVMILSAGFSLLYWLLESVRDAWVFHKGTVFIRFISPDPMSVWFRLLPILIVILFGIYILGLLKERTTLLSRQASLTKILEERNVEYFKLADNVKAGIFRAGREGTLLEANQAFLDMFGFTNKEELFTVRSLDLFKEDGVLFDLDKRLRRSGEVKVDAVLMKKKSGELLWCSITAIAIRNSSGRFLFYDGIVEDVSERKELQLQLEKQKLHFESVLENAPIAIVALNKDHQVIDWNPGSQEVFQYTKEEVLGRDIDSLIAKKNIWDECRDMGNRILDGESVIAKETVRYRKDGSPVHVLCSGSGFEIDGKLEGIVAVYKDITQMIETENALKESEQKYRLITETTTDVIWTFDLNGIPTYVSPSVEQLLGYSSDEILLLSINDLLCDPWREVMDHLIKEELDKERSGKSNSDGARTVELALRSKDGREIWVENKATFLRNGEKRPIGIHVVSRDVTERRKAEIELKRLNRALKTLSAGNKALVRASNEETLLRDVCDILHEIGEYSFSWAGLTERGHKIKIRPVAFAGDFIESDSDEEILSSLDKYIDTEAVEYIRSARTYLVTSKEEAESRLILPLYHSGHILGTLCIHNQSAQGFDNDEIGLLEEMAGDLAFGISVLRTRQAQKKSEEEKNEIQKQLLQAQKMEAVGIMTGGIAHDFNNILTAIIGCSDMALLDVDEDDPVYSDLNDIKNAANRAADLTKQLLLFSRKQPMKFEIVRLDQIIQNLVKVLRRLIGENISIQMGFEKNLWAVCADQGTLVQVIMNLAVNARDAMPEGGSLTFRGCNVILEEDCIDNPDIRPGKYLELTVSDTGHGMKEEVRQRIFEPFFSTKSKNNGTGLGLSVVYGIIKQHEGSIEVKSEPGKGTSFTIYLPAIPNVEKVDHIERFSTEEYNGQGKRVLIVEDEEKVLEFTTNGLNRSGFSVFSASNAVEAKEIFEREGGDFDMVISDVGLPGQSGIELVSELKQVKPELKVLLSSGYSDHHTRWPLIKKNGYKFLEKPYALNELLYEIFQLNA